MTALELYELVKPLIGTEWEPEGLTFNGAVWIHADLARSEDGYGAAFPVPAARALWEVSILDGLEDACAVSSQRHPEGGIYVTVTHGPRSEIYVFRAPSRIKALVAAAVAVKGTQP